MKIPFTIQEFLGLFKSYNLSVYPMQAFLFLLGVFGAYRAISPTSISGRSVSGILSFFWLWMGIVYHLLFFTRINKAAYLFGSLFIIQGILFAVYGIFRHELTYRYRRDVYGITGLIFVLYALIGYPALGYLLGHVYPYSPTFGLPCPTTIFTFGMLLQVNRRCPPVILIIPVLWSLIGFAAAFKLGIREDTGLVVAGVVATSMILYRNRKLRHS